MPERSYALRRGDVPAALRYVESVLVAPTTRVLKSNARVTVAVVPADGDALVLKRFRDEGPLRLVQVLVLGSSAARVWRAAGLMQAAGFAVPAPVAVLEDRVLGIAARSCAVSRWVDGAPLDEIWRARRGAARRSLTLAFADYLRQLHAAGLYPQDLRAANVLVANENPPRFVLVDLDRVRRYRRLSWRRRRKNVVQVHRSVGRGAPRRESLRFLQRYLGNPSPPELRRVAAEIASMGRRKDAEYARRRGLAVPRPEGQRP
jgi:lipopolysaccharide kinase (Kdo/WaaP) family protein